MAAEADAKVSRSTHTKITARFVAPVWRDFDKRVEDALLRRDAFLDQMIAVEVGFLDSELSALRPQSPRSRKHVSDSLHRLGGIGFPSLKQVSIVLRTETSERLNSVCNQHGVHRDAFLNRLVLFLRASDKLLDWLDLPKTVDEASRSGAQSMPTAPLAAVEHVLHDPLYYLRSYCEEAYGCGLYALQLDQKLRGFECYVPDEDLPGTEAHSERLRRDKEFERLLSELEAAPSDTTQPTTASTHNRENEGETK